MGVSLEPDGTAAMLSAPLPPSTHAVFDIVVDDKIQLLVGEAIALRQHPVYFADDGLGMLRVELIVNDLPRLHNNLG
ncbi:hypothetical protein M1O17_04715 [Dehalococcoidia bacterium]|nr:hypothetical protein [Dehalococcoidia bacterium]